MKFVRVCVCVMCVCMCVVCVGCLCVMCVVCACVCVACALCVYGMSGLWSQGRESTGELLPGPGGGTRWLPLPLLSLA